MKNAESLNIFSKILTKENITLVVDSKASTGSFDLGKRILRIPDWAFDNENFNKMLVSHECAHAIYTPYDGWKNFLKKHKETASYAGQVLNIVEDCRIDRLMQERHPGLKKTYALSARYIIDSNFFKINKAIEDYDFFNRINIHFKGKFTFPNYDVQFSDVEQPYVDRIEKLKTWDEVVAITEELLEKFSTDQELQSLDEFEESEEEENEKKEGQVSQGEGQGQSSGKTEKGKEAGEGGLKEGRYNVNEDMFGEGSDEKKESNSNAAAPGIQKGNVETYENLMKQIKANGGQANIAVSYNVNSGTLVLKQPKSVDIPSVISDSYSSNTSSRNSVEKEYTAWVNNFAMQFEQKKRGREIQKTLLNKTGILDAQKMCLYQITEDIFRTNVVEEKQLNHGFVVLVDFSSSMTEVFSKVIEQFYGIYAVCAKIGIPFKGYGFTTGDGRYGKQVTYDCPFSNGYNSLSLTKLFDTDAGKKYNKNVLNFLTSGQVRMGGTPLSDAIYNMIPVLQSIRDRSTVDILNFIVLTDGGDGCGNVSQYMNYRNHIFPAGLSTRGNYDNTNALYKLIRTLYNVNVTTIDISSHIGGSNLSSKDIDTFNRKGQVAIKEAGGTNNCVVINPKNATSKNREIIRILTNILS